MRHFPLTDHGGARDARSIWTAGAFWVDAPVPRATGRQFIARAAGGRAIAEGRRSSLVGGSVRALCFFNLEPAMVVGAGVRGGGWPGSEGWLVGGAAAGEVAGGRGGGGRRRP